MREKEGRKGEREETWATLKDQKQSQSHMLSSHSGLKFDLVPRNLLRWEHKETGCHRKELRISRISHKNCQLN